MGAKIEVTITITEEAFRREIKNAGLKVLDEKQFAKLFRQKKLAKALKSDLLICWQELNADDDGDSLFNLLNDIAPDVVDFAFNC